MKLTEKDIGKKYKNERNVVYSVDYYSPEKDMFLLSIVGDIEDKNLYRCHSDGVFDDGGLPKLTLN